MKQMSFKNFRLLVLGLDLLILVSLIILLLYPNTSQATVRIFEESKDDIIPYMGFVFLVLLNWQMFDERYIEEKKLGVYEKNELARKKSSRLICKYFNLAAIVNLCFIAYSIYSLLYGETFWVPDIVIAISSILFVLSSAFWVSSLLSPKK